MDLTPEGLERAEFETVASGFDPDAVRDLLRRVADRFRELERDGVRSVSDSVRSVLERALGSGEELVARAGADADAIRAAAETRAGEIIDRAERDAREHAAGVLEHAQRRLDALLAAEREVHERLKRAMSDLQEVAARVGVHQDREPALSGEDLGVAGTRTSA